MKKQAIVCVALGAAAAVTAYVVHRWVSNDVENLASFLFALVPFVLAAESVARFPEAWTKVWFLPALSATVVFLALMGGFAPLMFGAFVDEDFDRFYAIMRVLVAFVILGLAFMLRLGGARAGQVRRASYASLLVMLSGIEDLMFQVWRGTDIPDRWEWAEHITVRLGHVASQNEAIAFIAAHFVVAAVVLFAPAPGRRRARADAGPDAGSDAGSRAVADDTVDRTPSSLPS